MTESLRDALTAETDAFQQRIAAIFRDHLSEERGFSLAQLTYTLDIVAEACAQIRRAARQWEPAIVTFPAPAHVEEIIPSDAETE